MLQMPRVSGELADFLLEYRRTDLIMSVGTNLSYPEESITTGVPADFSAYSVEGVSVVLLQQKNHTEPVVTHGIPDAAFIRAKVPMTKEEVRSISLSKLQLQADSVVYDVGAGTGSISIEAACMADRGIVYAIEQKEEAVALIRENSRKFGVSNLQVIHGKAPDALWILRRNPCIFRRNRWKHAGDHWLAAGTKSADPDCDQLYRTGNTGGNHCFTAGVGDL